MCSKKQFYYQKNVRPVSLVKFEFLGYNGLNKLKSTEQERQPILCRRNVVGNHGLNS